MIIFFMQNLFVYTIKHTEFYTYSQDIEIITDNYINIHNYNHNETMQE